MLIFDTLAFTKRLTESGMPQKQAEATVEGIKEVIENDLANKRDLRELEANLSNQTRAEINSVKVELKVLENTLRKDLAEAKIDLIKWMVGVGLTLVLSQVGMVFMLIRFFVRP